MKKHVSFAPLLRQLVLVALVALLTHLGVILWMSLARTQHFEQRLLHFGQGDGFHLLPAATPAFMPFLRADPALVMGFCRYDLTQHGQLHIVGKPPHGYWSLSVHTISGHRFYALTERAFAERTLDVRVVHQNDKNEAEKDSEDLSHLKDLADLDAALRVPSKVKHGFVIVHALVPHAGARQDVERALKTITCTAEELE